MKKLLRLLPWLLVPAALAVDFLGGPASVVFVVSCGALLVLAGLMGKATEHVAHRMGPAAGGLFNASFGNAAELIIGCAAIKRGLPVVVKASLTGSILGNLLLVTGAAMLVGCWGKDGLRFSAGAAETHAAQLTLAVIGFFVPALFFHTAQQAHHPELVHGVSIGVSVILMLTYVAGLFFAFKTHKHLFHTTEAGGALEGAWSRGKAIGVLVAASALTAFVAEGLVGSIEEVGKRYGMTEVFLGVILLALVGNAAENSSAILLARKGKMDTALQITMQSSLQIALFVAPVLVFLSHALGHPIDLVFTELEVVAVMVAVLLLVVTILNGEANWFEGFQLLAVYAILAVAFYFVPEEAAGADPAALAPALR